MPSRPSYSAAVALVVAIQPVQAQSERSDSARATQTDSGAARTAIRILPVLGSAPETGFVGGATALRVSGVRGSTRPSTDQVYAAYTAKHQFRAFVSTDRWSRGNRWGLQAQLEYQRFPQAYYGVGVDAPETAEEWYEARAWTTGLTIRRRLTSALYGQFGYRFSDTEIHDADQGGAIAAGTVFGSAGGRVSQLVTGLAWDSRDNLFAPRLGSFLQATVGLSDDAFGADYSFSRYTADLRRYTKVGRGIIAAQAYLEATGGHAPFDQLSLVGSGSVMRGYARGRYRDRQLAAAQLEYRAPVIGRLGIAAFAGAGTVAPTLGGLASSTIHPSIGGGVRWLLLPSQGTTVRVDYGVGKGSSGLYIAFNDAF